eukprot:1194093-Pyramimonas_sp.AAC.1
MQRVVVRHLEHGRVGAAALAAGQTPKSARALQGKAGQRRGRGGEEEGGARTCDRAPIVTRAHTHTRKHATCAHAPLGPATECTRNRGSRIRQSQPRVAPAIESPSARTADPSQLHIIGELPHLQ